MGHAREDVPEPLRRLGVTAREATVLAEVVDRRRNPEIAERLVVSVRTVESHVAALLRKLEAPDRAALIGRGAALLQQPAPLPQPATSFVGRRRDLEQLAALLRRHRMVTLTGPGGVGKTRLAVRVVVGEAADHTDRVAFADLSAAANGDVARVLADALGVRDHTPRPGRQWHDAFRDHRGLVIIDNCEHVVVTVAHHVRALLDATQGLRVLATSREPLRVPGEVVHVLAPMAVPSAADGADPPGGTDAERLFAERADAIRPGFAPTGQDQAAIGELCRRLDGLPLAIELAAARLRTFSLTELVAHLEQRLVLLVDGARTARPRQQTLQATLDWSYDLLDEDEQTLLGRLAVFPGSFDYAAAEAVCCDTDLPPATVLRTLPQLVDRSLVTVLAAGSPTRYRLSESVRLHALQRSPGTHDDARRRHATHFLDLATAAAPELRGDDQREWLGRLESEHHNLLAALERTTTASTPETALRFLCALAPFWDDSGRGVEAQGWIDRVPMDHVEVEPATAVAAHIAASNLLRTSDVARARRFAEGALALAAEHGLGHTRAQMALGWAWAYTGRPDRAAPLLRGALEELGDGDPWDRAIVLQGLALIAPDLPETLELARAAGELFRDVGDRMRQANTLYTMATRALDAGVASDDTREWLDESLALSTTVDSDHHTAHAQLGLARHGWLRGEDEATEQHLGRCLPTLRRLGDLRCTGRALLLAAELAGHRGDVDRARALLAQSIHAAEPAADAPTVAAATRQLTALDAVR